MPFGIVGGSLYLTPEGESARENMKFFIDELSSKKGQHQKKDL